MIVTDPQAFLDAWRALPAQPWGAPYPVSAVLMSPDGLSATADTSADNRYMATGSDIEAAAVHAEHRALASALADQLPVAVFPGDADTPDATFLNNAFACVPGRLILGAMRYPQRQRETGRTDVQAFFSTLLDYEVVDLRAASQGGEVVAELTGSLVIDRLRGVGFCGLGERCNLEGASAMHEAFGLRLTFAFDLAPGEYHTNVIMSVLGGRSVVLCREGFADPAAADAIVTAYGDDAIVLDPAEKNAFAGNCIALREGSVWMSARAAGSLRADTARAFGDRGWTIRSVALPQIERAGGSLRCCVAEVF
jgi:hypothetical protein